MDTLASGDAAQQAAATDELPGGAVAFDIGVVFWRSGTLQDGLAAEPHAVIRAEPPIMNCVLTLVVLRCTDLDASERFYRALGLTLHSEKHGAGPAHWSATIGPTVLELYPSHAASTSLPRLGIAVPDVEAAVARAASLGARVDQDFDVETRRAVVVDPDGVKVELTEGP